jgi:tetraacyldisaccharide 4'-kinase
MWYGDSIDARVMRAALAPASWLYGAGVASRARRFIHDDTAVHGSAVPVLSIGNITVGGTGKTPVAAWAAAALRQKGATPAIVMRGYGDDEPLVHVRLNPDVRVVVDADRVRGVQRARNAAADCAILDDGFQHRRIARNSDWVLISAERWRDDLRLLPAGPLREPVQAMERADVLLVTRKSAALDEAERIAARMGRRFPALGVAVTHLAPDALVDPQTGDRRPSAWLEGKPVVGVAAVGEPAAFFAQLRALGAHVEERPFRDHHAFTDSDVASLVRTASRSDGLICTLKDAVKLAPRWPPGAAPLLYVSQVVVIERGGAALDRALEAVLAARQAASSTAG